MTEDLDKLSEELRQIAGEIANMKAQQKKAQGPEESRTVPDYKRSGSKLQPA